MRNQRLLLWTALVAGLLAVIAGLAGEERLAAGAAVVLVVLIFATPWMRDP